VRFLCACLIRLTRCVEKDELLALDNCTDLSEQQRQLREVIRLQLINEKESIRR
jgi:hypothetical protein